MTRRKMSGFALLGTAIVIALALPGASSAQPKDGTLKIGMVKAFFNDLPDVIVKLVTEPFSDLMKSTTGLEGALSTDDDAFATARKLSDNTLQLGVFHGHEFAWVQKKYPELRPLMVVVNKHHDVRAFVVVRQNSPAKSMADLRGKNVDMPAGTKEHCRIYVEKHCGDNAQSDPKLFFGKIVKSESPIEALNDVCRDNVQAAIVDTITLEMYKRIKGPVFAKNLRILQQSDAFPPAVIVYKQGSINEKTLNQFRAGLSKANTTAAGREMLQMWSIDGFESVPENYAPSLVEVLKAYPAPETTKISLR